MLIFQNSLKIWKRLCEVNLTEKVLYNSLKSMQSDKSPGNDGLKVFLGNVSDWAEGNLCRFSLRSQRKRNFK